MTMFSAEQLNNLAKKYDNFTMLRTIAQHPNTSAETLEYISGYPFRLSLATHIKNHPNTPDYLKEYLDASVYVMFMFYTLSQEQ